MNEDCYTPNYIDVTDAERDVIATTFYLRTLFPAMLGAYFGHRRNAGSKPPES